MQNQNSIKTNDKNKIFCTLFATFSFIVFIVVAFLPSIADGLGALSIVPFFTFIFFVIFSDTVCRTTDLLGVFTVYAFILVRNTISPLLMALSGSTVRGLNCDPDSFRLAIISNVIETLFVFAILKSLYKNRITNEIKANKVAEKEFNVDISTIGIIIFCMLMALLLLRGHLGNVISYISVLGTQNYGDEPLYTYDFACFLAMKSVICLILIGFLYKSYKNSASGITKGIMFTFCLLFGLLNIAFYDGTARAHFLVTAIATMVVLSFLFPNKKKILFSSIFGMAIVIVAVIFLTDTLHFLDANRTIIVNSTSLSNLSNTIETYCNGISNVAYGFSTYANARARISFNTYLSNFVSQFGFGSFPGIRAITDAFTGEPNFTSIYRDFCSMYYYRGRGYILPPMIEALYTGGYFLMIPFDFLYFYIVLRFQRFLIYKRNGITNLLYIYVLAYMELLAGFCLGYDAWIEVHAMTNNVLYILIIVFFNSIGKRIRLKIHR